MEVKLFSGFAKRKDSTKRPDINNPTTTVNVALKVETSYINPAIEITSESYPVYTYAYITELNRYYFVASTKQRNRHFYEITLELDELATAKDNIANYNCFIERTSDNNYINGDIHDSAVSSTEKIVYSSQAETELFGGGAVVGFRTISFTNGISTYFGSLSTLAGLFNPEFDTDPTIFDLIDGLTKFFVCNPRNYLLDAYLLAVPVSKITPHCTTDFLASGWYSGGGAFRWDSANPTISDEVTIAKPAPYYSDFREGSSAFSEYSIYIPSVGEVPISADVMDATLSLKYSVDVNTGETAFFLYATRTSKSLVATYQGNIKAPLQVGSVLPSGSQLMGALSAAGGAAAASGAPQVGAMAAVQNVVNMPPSVNGSMGSFAGIIAEPKIKLTCVAKGSGDFPTNQVGRPCCKNLRIGDLSGYVKCGSPSIELAIESDILDSINSKLAAGFYYE